MGQPLKLLLVGNYAPDRQESMLRFGELLDQELKAHQYQVHYLNPPARLNRKGVRLYDSMPLPDYPALTART